MADPNDFQIIHTIWTGAITVAGGIVAFFTKRLVDHIDDKADKEDVNDLKVDIQNLIERQDRHHEGNVERLDKIIMELGGRDRNRRDRQSDR